MQINLNSQLRKLSSRINLFSVMNEAVVNSIQANATKIEIIFYRENIQGDLFNAKPKIVGMDIIDNGEGFIDKNINSFSEYGSDLKLKEGCKGIGRLCFLKVFDNVTIESLISSANERISVNFTTEFQKEDFQCAKVKDIISNKTKISFKNIKLNYGKYLELTELREHLYDHILPLLYLNAERKITIALIDDKEQAKEYINIDGLVFEKEVFVIKEFITNDKKEYQFVLHYFFEAISEPEG